MSSAALRHARASWRKITLSSGMFARSACRSHCNARASQRGMSLGFNQSLGFNLVFLLNIRLALTQHPTCPNRFSLCIGFVL
jgi:hypothetical protein